MALDAKLLDVLACPKDKGPLLYFEDEEALFNPRLKLKYRVTDGIPVMLVDEAEHVSDEEAVRLEAKTAGPGASGQEAPGQGASGEGQTAE